jgi:FAD/FMN-containing dehydrogenase
LSVLLRIVLISPAFEGGGNELDEWPAAWCPASIAPRRRLRFRNRKGRRVAAALRRHRLLWSSNPNSRYGALRGYTLGHDRQPQAEAGTRMRDLYAHMEQAGLALPCLPNVDAIQLGGAIANATLGTCIQHGSMCSLVDEIELVVFRPGRGGRADGRSELLRLRRSTTDPAERHLFEAAVASIGSLGVIYAVTLRCVPPYHSYVHERALPFDALRHRFAEMARQYYSLRLMWFPLADIVFTKIQVPIHGPMVRALSRSTVTRLDAFTIKLVAFADERNPRRWRRLRRMVGRLVAKQFQQNREKLLATHSKEMLCTWYDAEIDSRLHTAFATHPFVNLEYAVPLDRIDEVIEELRTLLPNYPLQAMNAVGLRPLALTTWDIWRRRRARR